MKGANGLTVYIPMNQKPIPNKKKISPTDIILILLGVFVLIRTPWGNMNSFYYLLFFLYIFCIMMRITNMRKKNTRKENLQQREETSSTLEEKNTELLSEKTNTPEEINNAVVSEKEPPTQE